VDHQTLQRQLELGRFYATNDFAELSDLDTVSICVPTPLSKTKEPDLSYIIQAVDAVANHLHRGHCLPIDPVYLIWKARANGFEPRLIEVAQQINSRMPHHVIDRTTAALNDEGKPLRGSRVHILGVAYKCDVADMRESPALHIMHLLTERKAQLSYSDPFVPRLSEPVLEFETEPLSVLNEKDCVVIVTDHSSFDYEAIVRDAPLIVDTRNALSRFREKKIYRLQKAWPICLSGTIPRRDAEITEPCQS